MIWGRSDAELRKWHRWYAWHPVTLDDGRWAWLCWVERAADYGGYGVSWNYRLPGCPG
jgi:hypothetical protein